MHDIMDMTNNYLHIFTFMYININEEIFYQYKYKKGKN